MLEGLLGYPAAYFPASVRPATRQLLLLSVIVPFFLSVLVRNYVWMVLLQRTGLVNRTLLGWNVISHPLELMYNELGVLIAMVNMLLPYMIFPVLSALLAIPSELSHASASLGAGAVRTFWRVTLPLTLPGVAAGGLLVFIVALGFFITPALLGGPKQMMISNLIEFSVRQVLNWPFAFALANTLLCGTLLLYFIYIRLLEHLGEGHGTSILCGSRVSINARISPLFHSRAPVAMPATSPPGRTTNVAGMPVTRHAPAARLSGSSRIGNVSPWLRM